jgi:hypothetical protein
LTRREKIFWLIIGAVFIVGFVFLIPACNHGYEQGNDPQQQQCPGNKIAFLAIRHAAEFIDIHNWILTALFAGLVTLFTWRLWQATNELRVSTDRLWNAGDEQLKFVKESSAEQAANMRASIDANRMAAEAAQDAANGLKSAERPHMVVSELKVSGRNSAQNAEGNVEILLAIQVMNSGRSPAFAKELSLQIIFGRELSSVPAYSNSQQLRGATVPTRSWGTEWPTKIDVPAFLVQLSNAQEAEIFVFGYFKYADIFELLHETAFAYQIVFDPGADSSKHFAAADPSAYWRYT